MKIINRYLSDALTPQEALELLERGQEGKEERIERLHTQGYPAYTTPQDGSDIHLRRSRTSSARRWKKGSPDSK